MNIINQVSLGLFSSTFDFCPPRLFGNVVLIWLFPFTDVLAEGRKMASFKMGSRGNYILLDDLGYMYKQNAKRQSHIYWICRERHKYGCNARAVTEGMQYAISFTGKHDHQ